jgi:predicted RNase H-like nuclease
VPRRPNRARVIGVDACRKGWVGFTSDARGYFGETVEELLAAADVDGRVGTVAVDIPIGLPTNGTRRADVVARKMVGRRSSSVFVTPVRQALLAPTYADASVRNVEATGMGLSRQAYGLRAKILDVDAWVRESGREVVEVHPEVCFAVMAGRTLAFSKVTWAGAEERRRALAGVGIDVPSDLGIAGQMASVDDVLDAAAASWTAARHAAGRAVPHPEVPEMFDDGLPAAIWV